MLIHFAHANGIPNASYLPILEQVNSPFIYKSMLGHDKNFPRTPNWGYLVDEMIAYIENNTSDPVVAVGHSLGALLSYMASSKRPDLFSGVLMFDPPVFWGKTTYALKLAKYFRLMDRFSPSGKSKYRKREWPDKEQAKAYFATKKLFAFDKECFDAFCEAAITQQKDGTVRLSYSVDVEVDIFRNTPDNLNKYQNNSAMPVKIIAGSNGIRNEAVVKSFSHFAKAQYEIVTGDHMFPLRNSGLTVVKINEFIDSLQKS